MKKTKKIAVFGFSEEQIQTDSNSFMAWLNRHFTEQGGEVHAAQYFLDNNVDADAIFCINLQSTLTYLKKTRADNLKKAKKYSFVMEPPVTYWKKNLWDKASHQAYAGIFTFNRPLVDNKKYIHAMYPLNLDYHYDEDAKREKFCVMINGNIYATEPNELYTARRDVIRYAERYGMSDFELYGSGWDEGCPRFEWPNRFAVKHVLTTKKIAKIRLLNKPYKTWKGRVDDKRQLLSNTDFCICFENMKGLDGYITEKIYDCFVAGCIPVYYGPDAVTDYIPANTFIDYRDFNGPEDLFKYLRSLDEASKANYRKHIKDYLKSPQSKLFTAEQTAQTIVNKIINDYSASTA